MGALSNIENLVEHLTGKVEILIGEREEMLPEISALRKRLMERDKEAVKTAQDMRSALETVQIDALRFEQERIRIEARLKVLNDRLTALVSDKKCCGG